jgi:hypothetical protein
VRLPPADASYVVLSLAATLAFSAFAWSAHADVEQKLRWPKVPGTIGRASAEPFLTGYLPHLEYGYYAAGQRRVGSEILRPAWYRDKAALDGFISRNPIGEPLEVHVDPSDARRSWAYAGPAYTAWWPLPAALGTFFASICALCTLAFGNAYRAHRERERRQR